MIYLKSFLIIFTILIPILRINQTLNKKNNLPNRYNITLLSILFSIGTFISMYIGTVINSVFNSIILTRFGYFILIIYSLYYFLQFKKKNEFKSGLDTSFYLEEQQKTNIFLNNPELIQINKFSLLDIKSCTKFAYYLTLKNFFILFSSALINIDTSLSITFTFIISMIFFFIYDLIKNSSLLSFTVKYEELLIGILLILICILSFPK